MSLSPEFLDELRNRTSLSQLLRRDVRLIKAGTEYKACCPFHNEKSASFYVNDDKGFYHCFGCSAHGDAISWLTDHGGMQFMDAVKELAAAAGMDMPARDQRAQAEQDRRAPLFEAMDAAARFYASHRDARAPAAYMEQRGIDRDLAQTFGIGFAPDGGGHLTPALRNFSSSTLIEAGLLKQPDDDRAPYDRFRARLMFPIHDARGRVIGFGGRVLGKGEPKYLNSPDTPLFDKGRSLFNYHRAAPAARKTNRLVVVEGYMDVIGLARAGILDVVAPNGTAVTEQQLALMWKLSPEPTFCMDGDRAGQAAMIKAAVRALPGLEPDRSLRFAALPVGKDPDDIAREGGQEALEAVLAASVGLAELLWRHETAQGRLDEPEGRAGLKQRLIEHTLSIRDQNVRTQYQTEFRRRFDEAFAAPVAPVAPAAAPPRFSARTENGRRDWKKRERPVSDSTRAIAGGIGDQVRLAILAGCLRFPMVVAEHMEAVACLRVTGRYKQLLDLLVDAAMEGELSPDVSDLLEDNGMSGAPRALSDSIRLPFAFLTGTDESARNALVDAIFAETAR